jgi:hypothetical protein
LGGFFFGLSFTPLQPLDDLVVDAVECGGEVLVGWLGTENPSSD